MKTTAGWRRSETEIVRSGAPADARSQVKSGRSAAATLSGLMILGISILVAATLAAGEPPSGAPAAGLIGAIYATVTALGLRLYGGASRMGTTIAWAAILLIFGYALPSLTALLYSQETEEARRIVQFGIPSLFALSVFVIAAWQAPALRRISRFLVFVIGWAVLGSLGFALLLALLQNMEPISTPTRVLAYQVTGLVAHLPMFAVLGYWLQRGAETARP